MKEQCTTPHAVNGNVVDGGEGGMQLQASVCEHVFTSINGRKSGSKSGTGFQRFREGKKQHMWMNFAVPCQLQEIQGLQCVFVV